MVTASIQYGLLLKYVSISFKYNNVKFFFPAYFFEFSLTCFCVVWYIVGS